MLKDNQNSKKTILITGASQGIGKTCAIKFLKEGYKVAVLARNNLEFFKEKFDKLL